VTAPAVLDREDVARRRAVDAAWTTGFAGLLGVVVPLSLVGDITSPLRSTNHALVFALCVFAAARLGALLGGRRRQYLTITFYLFVYIWFGLAAVVQLDAEYFHFPEYFLGRGFDGTTRLTATTMIWVGVVAYEVGLRLARPSRVRPVRRRLDARRVHLLAIAGLVSSAAALVMAGSVSVLFTNREEFYGTFGTRTDGGFLSLAADVALRLPVFVAAILLVYLYRQPGGLRWSRAPLGRRVLVVSTIGTALLVNNITSATRAIVGALAFALLFAWLRPSQHQLRRIAFVLVLVAVLFVYPLANSFRRANDASGPRAEGSMSVRDDLLYAGGFGMFAQVHTAVEYVDRDGHRFGRQLLGSALFLVPRTLWTGKPVDTGDLMHDAVGYPTRLNQSSPLWTEFYVDGGFLLVILGFLGYGWISARLQRRLDEQHPFSLGAVLVPILAGYQLYVLRGSLLAATPRLAVLLGLVFLTTSTVGARTAAPSRPGSATR
jgi:hypothetical protein